VLERPAHVEARLTDLGYLEGTRVGELLEHELVVPVARLKGLVRVRVRFRIRVRVRVGVGARFRIRVRVRAGVGARVRVRVRVSSSPGWA
tara:strand:+ start:255 stop:524 length:270 start_codon:yes stop_codon:yes gene_type:complete